MQRSNLFFDECYYEFSLADFSSAYDRNGQITLQEFEQAVQNLGIGLGRDHVVALAGSQDRDLLQTGMCARTAQQRTPLIPSSSPPNDRLFLTSACIQGPLQEARAEVQPRIAGVGDGAGEAGTVRRAGSCCPAGILLASVCHI